jgi:hypothetical protein
MTHVWHNCRKSLFECATNASENCRCRLYMHSISTGMYELATSAWRHLAEGLKRFASHRIDFFAMTVHRIWRKIAAVNVVEWRKWVVINCKFTFWKVYSDWNHIVFGVQVETVCSSLTLCARSRSSSAFLGSARCTPVSYTYKQKNTVWVWHG